MIGFLLRALAVSEPLVHDPGHAPLHAGFEDAHYGMSPPFYALVFGILSGTSLPIGAALGITFSPVSDKTCALMMAFGAGALLFAVTVELYGHALREVEKGRLGLFEMFTTIFGALAGAAFYLTINQWLEEYLMSDEEHEVNPDLEKIEAPHESDSLMHELRKQREHLEAAKKEEKEHVESKQEKEEKPVPQRRISEVAETMFKKEEGSEAAGAAEQGTPQKRTGKALWGTAGRKAKTVAKMTLMKEKDLQGVRGREKAIRALLDPKEIQHAKSVAFALFLGLLVDGVPEGVLMGFLAAEGHLTPVLIISLFVANFPEAFSSSSLLVQAQFSVAKIIGMWTSLCLLVGTLGGLSCYLLLLWFPTFGQGGHGEELPMSVLIGIALVEGITGGAMIACIAAVMLPEAFERAKGPDGKTGRFYTQSGFLCASGFLASVALKALFG